MSKAHSHSHDAYHNDSMSTTIIRRGNGTEALLSGRVPNLELDRLLIELNGADFLCAKVKYERETEDDAAIMYVNII